MEDTVQNVGDWVAVITKAKRAFRFVLFFEFSESLSATWTLITPKGFSQIYAGAMNGYLSSPCINWEV